ncbi:MAG: N-acetylmuramoyl-L-alanine amidase [Actinomycetota bacterium]|nr:N-acetylmuramoyl-L-alanine amidase [Actinomycetota bacterium]
MQVYRLGDRGPAVAEIRATLRGLGMLAAAGQAGTGLAYDRARYDDACERAVRDFQQRRGLSVDGIVGKETYRALEEARWRLGDRVLTLRGGSPYAGDDVVSLQERLLGLGFDAGRADGVFGPRTAGALGEFQRNYGLVADGTCGPLTLKALGRLRRAVAGGSPHALREAEVLHQAGPTVVGKTVVIDAGHGGQDPGNRAGGLSEAELVADLAGRLEGRLAAAGVTALPTHGPLRAPSDGERAAVANAAEADLLVSLHIDAAASVSCQGVASFYYGTPGGAHSAMGERLAGLVQRELVARTDLADCRYHPKTWDLLRWTRMPAVRVDLGYLTSRSDRARLAAPEFRDVVAEALLIAIQRLYLPNEQDPGTGAMRLPALVSF